MHHNLMSFDFFLKSFFFLVSTPSASVCVCVHGCANSFAKLSIWCHLRHSHVTLFLVSHPSSCVCLCLQRCALLFYRLFIWCHFGALACVYLLLVSQSSARVCMCVFAFACTCLCLSFCTIIHLISIGCIRLFFLFYWYHIPVQVFVCVTVYSCALLFAPLFIWCHLKSFFFLVSHPSASVCVCLCMAVPFFLHHYSSDVIAVNSLVCHHSLGHTTMRFCLCMSVPLF